MPKRSLYYFIVLNLFFSVRSFAQTSIKDTALYTSSINHIIQLYIDSLKENLRLYDGNEFAGNYPGVSGHPYFEFPEPQKGDVFYDGIYYPGVLLSYDIINDDVIFINPVNNRIIKLAKQKINRFTLQDHLFENINEPTGATNFPGSGFYEILYDGTAAVLSKTVKQLDQSLRAGEASKFIQWRWYYVRVGTVYYAVSNKRSLLAVCKDHKREVAEFMQKENLNFKKDPANTIVKVIAYYTQLKNN